MALSDWDKKHLDLNQQRAVQTYTAEWEKAKRAGNTERMRWAHNGAETIRRQAGYSGGKEGSTFLPAQDTAKTTNTGTAGKANQQKGYDNGSLTTQQVKQLQAALGVMQDGYFGPASQAAAQAVFGTSDPDAAYRAATGRNETDTPTGTTAAGMNESIFNQEARVIMSYLGQGMVDQAQNRLARIWNSLSADQQQVLTNALTSNGYTS